MQKAIVAIEDSRFFEHGPLDMKGSVRALVTNAQDGGIKQGGSTLTQQYVKNLLVENAKSDKDAEAAKAPNFGRKLRELRYAVNVEKRAQQEPDPRGLPQHRLLRLRGVRGPGRRAVLLQQERLRAHARRGDAAGGRHQQPVLLRPRDQPEGRHGPAQRRALPHGRPEDDHQAAGRRDRRRSPSSCTSSTRRPTAPTARPRSSASTSRTRSSATPPSARPRPTASGCSTAAASRSVRRST